MKLFLLSALLFASSFSNLTAQNTVKLRVPLVAASSKIDSLIDVYSDFEYKSNFVILFSFSEHKGRYAFFLTYLKSDSQIINLGLSKINYVTLIPKFKDNLRFFYYRKYLVFVCGPNEPYGFFIPQNKSKNFSFISDNAILQKRSSESPISIHLFSFIDGQFNQLPPVH